MPEDPDDVVPVIETEPPYSIAFVAALHGSYYPPDLTRSLLGGVRSDTAGAAMLDALTLTQLELRLAAQR